MEDVLVDFHLAQGIAEVQGGNREVQTYKNVQAVFRKHHITEERFDSSLIYYSTYSEKLSEIYKRVALRVETQASLMGAESQPVQSDQYSELTNEGDTANIWADQKFCILQPNKLQNIFSFHIPADSTFRKGDSFLWRFNTLFRNQGTLRDVYTILLVRYQKDEETDTMANVATQLHDSKLYEVRYDPSTRLDTLPIKSVSGYVFWSIAEKKDADQFALLIMKDLSLIRFHKESSADASLETSLTDSLESDTIQEIDEIRQPVRLSPTERRESQPREQKQRIRKESPIDPSLYNPNPRRNNTNRRRR